jgi:hypothetical protein
MTLRTATIRVNRETRDLLAEQAREEGVSLASSLARLAEERQRAAAWQSERTASRGDAESSQAREEDREWDATLADGFD